MEKVLYDEIKQHPTLKISFDMTAWFMKRIDKNVMKKLFHLSKTINIGDTKFMKTFTIKRKDDVKKFSRIMFDILSNPDSWNLKESGFVFDWFKNATFYID